jgi:hypothetical protein
MINRFYIGDNVYVIAGKSIKQQDKCTTCNGTLGVIFTDYNGNQDKCVCPQCKGFSTFTYRVVSEVLNGTIVSINMGDVELEYGIEDNEGGYIGDVIRCENEIYKTFEEANSAIITETVDNINKTD